MGSVEFQTYPNYPIPPLFPRWGDNLPIGPQPPVYAWRAWLDPGTTITSSVVTPRPLSDLPATMLAIEWYASPPGYDVRMTRDYGKGAGNDPYTFYMPDGTTRVNSSNMSANAFNQLLGNLLANQPYPP